MRRDVASDHGAAARSAELVARALTRSEARDNGQLTAREVGAEGRPVGDDHAGVVVARCAVRRYAALEPDSTTRDHDEQHEYDTPHALMIPPFIEPSR